MVLRWNSFLEALTIPPPLFFFFFLDFLNMCVIAVKGFGYGFWSTWISEQMSALKKIPVPYFSLSAHKEWNGAIIAKPYQLSFYCSSWLIYIR